MKPKITFDEILSENWQTPIAKKESRDAPAQKPDSVSLSIRAGKSLQGPKTPPPASAPDHISKDNQGNRATLSQTGLNLADPDDVAWETRLK